MVKSEAGVKGAKRPYRSTRRAAQARETRRAVIAAATGLFVERGYGVTTIDAIAEAADVGRATVFAAVGGKAELLKAAYDVALVGDDEPVALPDRPASRRVMAEPDAARMLGISPHTARHHTESVLTKFGVRSREALRRAITEAPTA